MPRYLIALAALALGFVTSAEPSRASNEPPWCAIENNGAGAVREICRFWTIEECEREVVSGNRGTCGVNPYWTGAQREGRPAKRKRQR